MDDIKEFIRPLFHFIAIGILIGLGLKVVDFTFGRPPVKLLICIADQDEVIGTCKPFEDYVNNSKE